MITVTYHNRTFQISEDDARLIGQNAVDIHDQDLGYFRISHKERILLEARWTGNRHLSRQALMKIIAECKAFYQADLVDAKYYQKIWVNIEGGCRINHLWYWLGERHSTTTVLYRRENGEMIFREFDQKKNHAGQQISYYTTNQTTNQTL